MSKEKVSLKEWATDLNLSNLKESLYRLVKSSVAIKTCFIDEEFKKIQLTVRIPKIESNENIYLNLPPFLKACLAKEIKSELAYERRESFAFYVIRFWEK